MNFVKVTGLFLGFFLFEVKPKKSLKKGNKKP